MILKDFLDKVKDLPPDTTICIAEIEEAYASNIAEIEIVEEASGESRIANGAEVIALEGGDDRVVVIRW